MNNLTKGKSKSTKYQQPENFDVYALNASTYFGFCLCFRSTYFDVYALNLHILVSML